MNKLYQKILLLCNIFIILVGYSFYIEPFQLTINHIHLHNFQFQKILQRKTAIHISDLHIKKIGKHEKKVLKIINDLAPGFIFLTGDYVKWDGGYEPALTFLSRLQAKHGVWAVMGDYDYSNSRKSCLFCHKQGSGKPTQKHNVKFLRNSSQILHFPGGDVRISGIEENGEHDTIKNLQSSELLLPTIILSHSPLLFDHLTQDQDMLILAGDTHGGQIPLPSWVWKIIGYEKAARFNQGFFQQGKKKMYVTRGIGVSHIPLRFLRPPEIVVIHF